MKVKMVALSKTDGSEGDEYEFYGLQPGGVYDVVKISEEFEAMVIKNKNGKHVMVYNHEVEYCED